MKHVILISAFLVSCHLVACGSSEEPLSPAGTYNLTVAFGTGDCGLDGVSDNSVLTITGIGPYTLSTDDPTEEIEGTVTCAEECELSAVSTSVEVPGEVAYNLTIDRSGRIVGSGSLTSVLENGSSCSQAFSVTGQKI